MVCKGDHILLLIPGLEMSGGIFLLPHNTASQDLMAGTGQLYVITNLYQGKEKKGGVETFLIKIYVRIAII